MSRALRPGVAPAWQPCTSRGGQVYAIWTPPPSPPGTKEAQSRRTRLLSNPLSQRTNRGARTSPESSLLNEVLICPLMGDGDLVAVSVPL